MGSLIFHLHSTFNNNNNNNINFRQTTNQYSISLSPKLQTNRNHGKDKQVQWSWYDWPSFELTAYPSFHLHTTPLHQELRWELRGCCSYSAIIEPWKLTCYCPDHAGLADGTAAASEHLPRYFAKSGHVDADPKKTKKNGAGKGGWLVTTLRAEPAPSAQGWLLYTGVSKVKRYKMKASTLPTLVVDPILALTLPDWRTSRPSSSTLSKTPSSRRISMAVQVTMKNSHQPAASIPRVPMAASMRMIRPRAFRLGNWWSRSSRCYTISNGLSGRLMMCCLLADSFSILLHHASWHRWISTGRFEPAVL